MTTASIFRPADCIFHLVAILSFFVPRKCVRRDAINKKKTGGKKTGGTETICASLEHTGMLANLLMCNRTVIDDAIKKVGPNVGKIRRWIQQQPRPDPKASRWRRKR